MDLKKHVNLPTISFIYFIGLTSWNPSLGSSVGLALTSALLGYQLFLDNLKLPTLVEEVAKLRQEFKATEESLKHHYIEDLNKIKEEVSRLTISLTKLPPPMSQDRARTKVQF